LTDSTGNYVLSGFGAGPYTVVPSKTPQSCAGAPNGIFANDAALISQFVVGAVQLTADQQTAAHVNTIMPGITSLDAAFVAQKIVGLCDSNNLAGKWVFSPDSVPHPSGVSGQLVENYTAYLLGDVSGDWNAAGAGLDRGFSIFEMPAVVSISSVVAPAGSTATMQLRLDDLQGILIDSYQFDLVYDPSVIVPSDGMVTVAGTLSESLSLVYNKSEPGLLKVAVYGAVPVTGDGVYLDLHFKVKGPTGSFSRLVIDGFRLDAGSAPLKVENGSLWVAGHAAKTG
jgi:hypothetical protein